MSSRKSTATLAVAPHGLIGQTFDGDSMAVDGAVDDYSPDVVVTSVRALRPLCCVCACKHIQE